ncbi:MAG: glycosyltransferase family 39 protein [Candidatus Methanoperedens sp.]|nr:glycosyltransferase family 39 protein [Candidatus Methanoperedens sp.]
MYNLKKVDDFYNKLLESKLIYFLIGFAILISYYILYLFRTVDNTVLMSWNLVFNYGVYNIYDLLLILPIVIFLSFIISRINYNKYNQERYHILFLFFIGMIIGTLFWNIPEINPDAARFFTEAKYLELKGIWGYFNDWGYEFFVWSDFPSVPFFYGILFRYLGEFREYIQIFNTILFSLTSVLTYKISKRLWNEEIGIYSGLLLMSFPFLLSQIPLMLVDIPFMFLVMLSAFLLFKVFDNKYYSIPASIIIFFALYAKLSSILILCPIIFILIINYRSVILNKKRWIFTIFFSLTLTILFFIWKMDAILQSEKTNFQAFDINRFSENPLNYFYQIGFIVIILAIYSIIIGIRKKDMNYIIVIAWVTITFLFLYDVRIRYMIPVFPFIAIMASLSIYSISNTDVKKFLISSLVLTSIAFSVYAYIPYEENFTDKNIKDAAEFTNSLNIQEIQLFLDFSDKHPFNPDVLVILFDLYSHKKIIYSQDNKFYPVKDYSNAFTAYYKIPSFYYDNKSLSPLKNNYAIIIISDKEQSNFISSKYLENHILVKKFEGKTVSILIPSSVKVYLPKE